MTFKPDSMIAKDPVPHWHAIRIEPSFGVSIMKSDESGGVMSVSIGQVSPTEGLKAGYVLQYPKTKLIFGLGYTDRFNKSWTVKYSRYASMFYGGIEFGNNTRPGLFYMQFQMGVMQGVISSAYYPFFYINPSFRVTRSLRRFELLISSALSYQGGETTLYPYYDCRYVLHGATCNPRYVTLNLHTIGILMSLQLQYNFQNRSGSGVQPVN